MSDVTFDLNLLIKESKDVLRSPKSYFAHIKLSGGITEPIIKAVIYSAIAGVIAIILHLFNINAFGGGMFGRTFGTLVFFREIVLSVIGLLFGAIILLVVSSACKGNTNYEANLRVMASVMVILPVTTFFGFTWHINFYLWTAIGLLINLYAIWLLYLGLVSSLKADAKSARIVSLVLIALTVLVMLLSLGRMERTYKNLKEFESKDYKGMSKN
jgi:hypothetical protein